MKFTNTNRDGVATAFELIIDEIEAVAADIANQGSKAFHDKAYDLAQQLGESGKNLQDFRAKVEKVRAVGPLPDRVGARGVYFEARAESEQEVLQKISAAIESSALK